MKKLLALILTLAMLLCSVSAMADTVLGAPFTANISNFISYFDTFYGTMGTGASVTWTEVDGGYLATAPGMLDTMFHVNANGQLTHISNTFTGSQAEFEAAAEPLGVSVSLIAMSALMGETADAAALQTHAASITADMTQVFACMLNAESYNQAQMENGLASSGTLMGYPAQLAYRVDFSNLTNLVFHVEFVLGPTGTTF